MPTNDAWHCGREVHRPLHRPSFALRVRLLSKGFCSTPTPPCSPTATASAPARCLLISVFELTTPRGFNVENVVSSASYGVRLARRFDADPGLGRHAVRGHDARRVGSAPASRCRVRSERDTSASNFIGVAAAPLPWAGSKPARREKYFGPHSRAQHFGEPTSLRANSLLDDLANQVELNRGDRDEVGEGYRQQPSAERPDDVLLMTRSAACGSLMVGDSVLGIPSTAQISSGSWLEANSARP